MTTFLDVPMGPLRLVRTLYERCRFWLRFYHSRVVGEGAVLLNGEPVDNSPSRIKLLPPSAFLEATDRYDLIVNVDSLTELDRSIAESYVEAIIPRTDRFLSINHEGNPVTVRELLAKPVAQGGVHVTRSPYWLRQGYVEEMVSVQNKPVLSR